MSAPQQDDTDALIAQMNARYAVVVEGGEVAILDRHFDEHYHRHVRSRLSIPAFRTLYRNRSTWQGKKRVSHADFWLDHPDRLTYERVIFDPSLEVAPPGVLNLWNGFTVQPKHEPWPRIQEHLFEIGAAGDEELYEFLLDWFAWLLLRPERTPGTAIVWQGGQGAGKGSIVAAFGRMLGQHFIHVSQVRHLVGHFNAHLQDALLLYADEAIWAGDKQSEGALKTLITEKTILIERKGYDPVMMPNRVHLVMATNHEWAVPMGLDDRRFCMVEVPDKKRGDRAYFSALHHEIENGGAAGLMWALMNRPADREPKIPKSVGVQSSALKQKILSMAPIERWWYQKLDQGQLLQNQPGWLSEAPRRELHEDYLKEMERVKLSRRASETELGIFLHRVMPTLGDGRRQSAIAREYIWRFPDLATARVEFARITQMSWLFMSSDGDDDAIF